MAPTRTNEKPGTRAVLRSYRASAYKFREVLNLIRGRDIKTAKEILAGLERDVADVIGKLLDSAVANAVNNDHISAEELYVASCFADEGPTMRRFRARARGRAGAIRKRTANVTMIVARMEEDQLKVVRSKRDAEEANRRARRVARTRGSAGARKVEEPSAQPETVSETPEAVVPEAADSEAVETEAVGAAESAVEEPVEAEATIEEAPVAESEVGDAEVAEEPAQAEGSAATEAKDDSEAADEAAGSAESEEEEK